MVVGPGQVFYLSLSLSLSSFCSSMEEYPSRDGAAKEVLGFLIADRLP